jgi:hypothetical protein
MSAFKPHDDCLIDQGDIFTNVPLMKWADGEPEEGSPTKRVVVTSHGCVCEDYDRAMAEGMTSAARRLYVQVAPLRAAKDKQAKLEVIKAGRMPEYFYIEGDGKKLDHQVADLSREQPIPAWVLVDRCQKIARIDDWQWNALCVHIAVGQFRVEAEDLFNPKILKGANRGT